jgi:hypothetical protein
MVPGILDRKRSHKYVFICQLKHFYIEPALMNLD